MSNIQIKDLGRVPHPAKLTVDSIFSKLAPWLLLVAGILLVFTILQLGKTSQQVQETSAYTRVSNCVLGKMANPPILQDEIERCYVQVEKNTGISLERFDEQVHGEK